MSHKIGPYLVLTTLLIILVFILGVRYGQRVEKANKQIDFVLSITPTPKPPTPTPISYQDYKSKKWGLKFTFPAHWQIKEATNSPAVFFELKP